MTRWFKNNSVSNSYLGLDLDPNLVQPIDWVSGCALFCNAATWQRLGGFDEQFFLYIEDVDLGRQAQALGIPVRYYPKIDVVHEIGGSAKRRALFSDYQHHRGMLLYSMKWSMRWAGPRWAGPLSWISFPFLFVGVASRFLLRRIKS